MATTVSKRKVSKPFTAEQFTATQWDSAEDKAKFANQFVRFLLSDCEENAFPMRFYRRLSMCFGHIAHYNQAGFYGTFFSSAEGKRDFMHMTLEHPCYGDPTYTYSDVERAIQSWIREHMATLPPSLRI